MLEKSKRRQIPQSKQCSNFPKDHTKPSYVSRVSLKKLKQVSQRQEQKIRQLMQQIEAKDSHICKMQQLISVDSKQGNLTEKFCRQNILKPPTDDHRAYWASLREGQNIAEQPFRRPKMSSFDNPQLPVLLSNQCTDRKQQGSQMLKLPLALLKQVTPNELAMRMKMRIAGGLSADPERIQR